jgi:hypothetical protein
MRCEASVRGMVAQVCAVLCAVRCVCAVHCAVVWYLCGVSAEYVGWVWPCDAMVRESGCEAVRVAVVCGVCG